MHDNDKSNTNNEYGDRSGAGSSWNNLKKGHEPDLDNSFHHKGQNDDVDESDYDTDTELDTWQKRGNHNRALLY